MFVLDWDDDFKVSSAVEPIYGQTFILKLAVEALIRPALLGFAYIDQKVGSSPTICPLQ